MKFPLIELSIVTLLLDQFPFLEVKKASGHNLNASNDCSGINKNGKKGNVQKKLTLIKE